MSFRMQLPFGTIETDPETVLQVLEEMGADQSATMGEAYNAEKEELDPIEFEARIRAKMQKAAVSKKSDEEGHGSAEELPACKAAGAAMRTATAPVEQAHTGTAAITRQP